jgi:hypothetical protein
MRLLKTDEPAAAGVAAPAFCKTGFWCLVPFKPAKAPRVVEGTAVTAWMPALDRWLSKAKSFKGDFAGL